jgi:ABC-type transport system involved in cytochrome bd biosynthesis fused ATPase/permease subunit
VRNNLLLADPKADDVALHRVIREAYRRMLAVQDGMLATG